MLGGGGGGKGVVGGCGGGGSAAGGSGGAGAGVDFGAEGCGFTFDNSETTFDGIVGCACWGDGGLVAG